MEEQWIIVDKDVSKSSFLWITARGVVLNEGKGLCQKTLRYRQENQTRPAAAKNRRRLRVPA